MARQLRTCVILLFLFAVSATPLILKMPKVATPYVPDVRTSWLFHGNGASFAFALPDTSAPVKPAPDTIPFFQMKEPDIRARIAQWQRYQTQLQNEYATAQGRIETYTEMLQQLKKPEAPDTTKHESKKKK